MYAPDGNRFRKRVMVGEATDEIVCAIVDFGSEKQHRVRHRPSSGAVAAVAARETDNMARQQAGRAANAQLRDDIRFLGRILGETISEQEGRDAFALVERVRQMSISYRRNEDRDARDTLEQELNKLSSHEVIQVTRAFSNFSHLANIAEDQHQIWHHRTHERAVAQCDGRITCALRRALDAGITSAQLKAFFDGALVSPVLTAHPTEVQRKSIRDRERDIAKLLDDRDRMRLTSEEAAANEQSLR